MLRAVAFTLLLSGVVFAAAPVDPPPSEGGAAPTSTVALSNEQFGVISFGLSILLFVGGALLGHDLAKL